MDWDSDDPVDDVSNAILDWIGRSQDSSRLACPVGLEPTTYSLEGCCSNPAELRAE